MAYWQIADWQIETDLYFPDLKQVTDKNKNLINLVEVSSLNFSRDIITQESINADGSYWFLIYYDQNSYFIEYPDKVIFKINCSAYLIEYLLIADLTSCHFKHLLLDQVIPLFLSCQDYLVLHTSAVESDNGTILFAGKSGSGKSTLVANLSNYHQFISDDFIALDSKLEFYPTYPVIRLWNKQCHNSKFINIDTEQCSDKHRFRMINDEDYIKIYSPDKIIALKRVPEMEKGDYKLIRTENSDGFKILLDSILIVNPNDPVVQKSIFTKCTEMLSRCKVYSLTFTDLDGVAEKLAIELTAL